MTDSHREFNFTDKHFMWLKKKVKQRTGISLNDNKTDLVYGRLARRIRKLNMDSFDQYCKYLNDDSEEEMTEFINAITTNLTSFFREEHHFDYLSKTILQHIQQELRIEKRLRVWSAGCSTGEEPYSIAMTLRESIPDIDKWDVKILATDIDTNVLSHASAGVYKKAKVNGVSAPRLRKWFLKNGNDEEDSEVKVSPDLRKLIVFKKLNLMGEWPMKGQFDILFCRNVVIYFNKDTQRVLFDRFSNILKDDAHMFLGHSESLFKVTDKFSPLGKTIHQKVVA